MVAGGKADVQGEISLRMLTSRIWFDGPEAEHVDPAVEARHDRYDVDGSHGLGGVVYRQVRPQKEFPGWRAGGSFASLIPREGHDLG